MNKYFSCGYVAFIISAAAVALSACGQGAESRGSAAVDAVKAPSAIAQPQLALPAKVVLRRAYVGSNIEEDGSLNEAKANFAIDEPIYVGVLLSDKPVVEEQITIAAEVFDANGNSVAAGRANVVGIDRAAAQLMPAASKLLPGAYVVVVRVNDVPSWEIRFKVQ